MRDLAAWMVIAILPVTFCAPVPARAAHLPRPGADSADAAAQGDVAAAKDAAQRIPAGTKVKAKTVEGKTVRGTLRSADDTGVAIDRWEQEGSRPAELRTSRLPYDALRSIARDDGEENPLNRFDQLNTRLKIGDTLYVTDARGRETKGTLLALDSDSLTVDAGEQVTLRAEDVNLVQKRKGDSIVNGLLIGAAVGGGACAVALSSVENHDEGALAAGMFCAVAVPVTSGVGALLDALVRGKRDIYSPANELGPRVSLAPVVTPRTKAVAVSVTF